MMFKRFNKKHTAILLLAVLIPFGIIVSMVGHYAVNVPVTDQYTLVPLIQKMEEGTLSFDDLWAQHNEHRILFPRLILLGLASLTDWSINAEIITSMIIALVGFSAIAILIHRTIRTKVTRLFLTFYASLWFFSPVQWQNWLWGWQLEWFLCICVSLFAFVAIDKVNRDNKVSKSLLLAIPAAFVAMLSLGSGIFIWPVLFVLLLANRASLKNLLVWLAASIASIGAYLVGYVSPGKQSPVENVIEQPVAFIQFFFAYIGRPVSNEPYAAILAGIMMTIAILLLLYFIWTKGILRQYSVWFGLTLYALVAGAAANASRLDFGIINAMSSRYTAFSLLIVVALMVIITGLLTTKNMLLTDSHKLSSVLIILGIFMTPLVISSYYNGTLGMQTQSKAFRYISECSREDNPTDECLYEVYFTDREDARDMLNYLKQKNYGGY